MKSVTTCPSCQTQFLVTDDQLSQYNGKVRCGHCLNVFNAIEYIKVDASPNDAPIETSTVPEDGSIFQPELIEEQVAITTSEASLGSAEPDSLLASQLADSAEFNEALVAPAVESIVEEHIEQTASDGTPSKREALLKELFEQANLPLEEVSNVLPEREEHIAEPTFNENEPVALDQKNYEEAMREINASEAKPEYQYYLEERKTASLGLIFLGVALILAAFLQAAFFYRHTIAMQFPEFKPSLVRLCNTLGCKINLPQEIQYFSIDDSTIEEDSSHAGVIRLSSTITNRAEFNQAFPNLEVTLTDTQDHPKLRRIFKPSEYLTKEYHLEEGIASGDSITINMPLMADEFKPAGFRLLVSY